MADKILPRRMVRPWHTVPAIPDATIKDVFGALIPDPRVEFLVLTFEYWLGGGATPTLLRSEMLKVLQGSISNENAYQLVSLLAKRGVAPEFFDLTRPAVDHDGSFRAILLANGITLDVIRYYATWNGIDPRDFLNGFVFGVGESAASVVFDLGELIKLIRQAAEWQLRTMLLLSVDPEATLNGLWDQINVVGQAVTGIAKEFDPSKLPAAILSKWKNWNAEFEGHLENLDAFSAGRLLGNLGGDLWQVITGVLALMKLLRLAGRLALRFGGVLLGRARKIAAEAAIVVADIAGTLKALERKVVDALPQIGLAALRTLFPPRLLAQLVEDGRALLTYGDRCIIAVFDEGYALAYAGDRMRAPFAAIVAESGKPVAMAAMSERLPPAAGKSLRAQAMASIDETLNRLDDLFLEFQTPAETALSHVLAAAAALQQVEQRLSTKLRKILLKVAYEAFTEFRNSGRRFNGAYLGRAIHQRMAQRIAIDVTKASPGLKVYTEKSLRTIYRSLSADRKIQDTLARQGEKVLGDRISSFVSARPELMDLIGLPESAAARRPVDVAKALREQFGWKHHTTYC